MKHILLLALSLAILCCSCTALAEENDLIVGVIDSIGIDVETFNQSTFDHYEQMHGAAPMDCALVGCANINTALLDLYADRIHLLSIPDFCARYIVSRDENLAANATKGGSHISFSMMIMEEDEEIFQLLNNAIIELRKNGTIDALRQEHIEKCIEGEENAAVSLPVFEGADTVSVAVTGDFPPMDYIAVSGAPAGFNLALLAEISELAQVNIEVVTVDALSRASALTSGRVDAVFWVANLFCPEEGHGILASEKLENTLITESFIEAPGAFVVKKQ